jgi:diketogulonate reductase-like aldo/keto reductase
MNMQSWGARRTHRWRNWPWRGCWRAGQHVVAIPGTTCRTHLEENLGAATLELQPQLIAKLDALINQRTVAGERYNAATQAEVDTENFATP